MNGVQFGLHTGSGVVGTQFVDLFFAALVHHHWPLALGHQGQGLGLRCVERLGAQAAAHHQ